MEVGNLDQSAKLTISCGIVYLELEFGMTKAILPREEITLLICCRCSQSSWLIKPKV
jgi:hypothetical protein